MNKDISPLEIWPIVLGMLTAVVCMNVAHMDLGQSGILGLFAAAIVSCLVHTARHTAHVYSACVLTVMANMEIAKEKQRFLLMRDSYNQVPDESTKIKT